MSKTKRFPLPIRGVDLLSNETSLTKGTVREASNIDIDRSGHFGTRPGYVRRAASAGLHSLYYASYKKWTLVAKDSVLNRLNTDTYDTEHLFTLDSADPVDYCQYNGNLYFSNRTTFGWVPRNDTAARYVGVDVPQPPRLSSGPGTLTPGEYGLVISVVDDRGEEGGATELQTFSVSEGGIRLAHLPQKAGWFIRVYITAPDGDVLRQAVEFPAVFPTYLVSEPGDGAEPTTQFLVPLAAGDIVRWHNGRIYSALDDQLRFSQPLRPHLYNPAHDIIPFSGRTSFVESVLDGLYVGDSRGVWFLSGSDPLEFQQRLVSTSKAVYKSSLMMDARDLAPEDLKTTSKVAVWLSDGGYVAGLPGGEVVALQADRLLLPEYSFGKTTYLVRDGRKQVITPVNSTFAAAFGTAKDSEIT